MEVALKNQKKKVFKSLKIYENFKAKQSKNYKSDLKWFDGVWSRFKPGLGKDKRGASGVDGKLLKNCRH